MRDRIKEALAYIDQESLTSLLTEMIDIPSPVGGERELALYLDDRFRKAGLTTRLQEVEPDRFNVYGLLEGTGGGGKPDVCRPPRHRLWRRRGGHPRSRSGISAEVLDRRRVDPRPGRPTT